MLDYIIENMLYLLCWSPVIAAFFILVYFVFLKSGECSNRHKIGALIFIIYVIFVLNVCGSVTATDVFVNVFGIKGGINIVPLKDFSPMGFALNVLLFIPFGFMLSLLFKGKDSIGKVIKYALLFSLAIEIGQLFKYRAADVDDLIANTLGAAVGFLLLKLFPKLKSVFSFEPHTYRKFFNYEPFILLVFAYALRFSLDPLAVSFIIKLYS